MIRMKAPLKTDLNKSSRAPLSKLRMLSTRSKPVVATISFPVRGDVCEPVRDNTEVIAEVVRTRIPDLLLCAGWSVPTEQSLPAISAASKEAKTVVVVETTAPSPVYFRIDNGNVNRMGEQFFSERVEADEKRLQRLSSALPDRSFSFRQREVVLLNCGEVMVVEGRNDVEFTQNVPRDLRDAVDAPKAIILNPTHTRMGNCGTVQAWRKHLSRSRRLYISASNWDVATGQMPSATIHSFWHNGEASTATFEFANESVCYREWELPK